MAENSVRPVRPPSARAGTGPAANPEPLRRHLADHIIPLVSAHLGALLDQPGPTEAATEAATAAR